MKKIKIFLEEIIFLEILLNWKILEWNVKI